jgi:cellulose synthase/poly-beta-1,6-N-acetylglucosamine synthase-like glycosyltransferase
MTKENPSIRLRVGLVVYNDKSITPETVKSIHCLCEDNYFETDIVKVTGVSACAGRNLAVSKGNPLDFRTDFEAHLKKSLLSFDYFLSIDGDSVFDSSTIRELTSLFEVYKNTKVIGICAPYPRRNHCHEIVAGYLDDKFNNNFLKLHEISHKSVPMIDVDWFGMGCSLIKSEYFYTAKYPWFRVPIIDTGKGYEDYTTEDIGFCIEAKKLGYILKITNHCFSGHVC